MNNKIKPKIKFFEAEYTLKRDSLNPTIIENIKLYNLVKKLTDKTYPSFKDKYDTRWEDFYLPLKRRGKKISIPFSVVKYKGDFFCHFFRLGLFQIKKGNKVTEKIFKEIFKEAIRFVHLIKQTREEIVRKTVPYDFRTGKIKGKYVLEELLPQKENTKIMKDYNSDLEKGLKAEGCSLNDYLNTASICYNAVFKKTEGLKPIEMYNRWADKRHGGMLDIKDGESKNEFLSWYKSGRWGGSHPFEIVFSWLGHGIHLYPPSEHNSWQYTLRVTDLNYAGVFIGMVKALIKKDIPFTASRLEEVLDYLVGESYFSVNDYSDSYLFYIPSREDKNRYFKYIEWDELKILKWKK